MLIFGASVAVSGSGGKNSQLRGRFGIDWRGLRRAVDRAPQDIVVRTPISTNCWRQGAAGSTVCIDSAMSHTI